MTLPSRSWQITMCLVTTYSSPVTLALPLRKTPRCTAIGGAARECRQFTVGSSSTPSRHLFINEYQWGKWEMPQRSTKPIFNLSLDTFFKNTQLETHTQQHPHFSVPACLHCSCPIPFLPHSLCPPSSFLELGNTGSCVLSYLCWSDHLESKIVHVKKAKEIRFKAMFSKLKILCLECPESLQGYPLDSFCT